LKIALAQLNPTVGDIYGNFDKLKTTLDSLKDKNVDIVLFSELFLTGYPPRDLLNKKWFIKRVMEVLRKIEDISLNYNFLIILGAPYPTNKSTGMGLYNSAIAIYNGKTIFIQNKSLLPTYDVFDEARYFDPADYIDIFSFKNKKIGLSICEDAWNSKELMPKRLYTFDPIDELSKKGAEIIINISASPFFVGKEKIRYKIIKNHSEKHKIPFVFINEIGGNDELIFDGRSMVLNEESKLIKIFPSFEEYIDIVDLNVSEPIKYEPEDEIQTVKKALVLGIRDYLRKCDFKQVVIGLSGGIDSAVTAALAVDAIGSENVLGVLMPGPYSSKGSVDDSVKLSKNLGIEYKIVPIVDIFNEYLKTLNSHFKNLSPDITEENLQARIRGNILMAFSNKFGRLVLSTGNKSELAVGYCTLYGDMSGGLAVISDVPKVMVYKLANYINMEKEIIPYEIINKPPSAELRENQKDEDSLPPYEILDKILQYYIEDGLYEDDIVNLGFNRDIVKWVIKTVNRNEYKRKQAAPGLKVTSKAFGMGRRIPIAAKY
jgi:NAD+ synthase (glutamine-hydrolysing)